MKRIALRPMQIFATAVLLLSVSWSLPSESSADEALALTPPSFAAAKAAADLAFPAESAGIAAYVQVDQNLNLEKIGSIIEERDISVGDNYLLGMVQVPNFGDNTKVQIYTDTTGWLVAYLKRHEPTAAIMQWLPANLDAPQIAIIRRNVLSDALDIVAAAAGVEVLPVKYYHFGYPAATHVTLFVTTTSSSGTKSSKVAIPEDYTLYEGSYFHYSYDGWSSQLKVDDVILSDAPAHRDKWWISTDFSLENTTSEQVFTLGTVHTIQVQFVEDGRSSAGVATALVYTPGE